MTDELGLAIAMIRDTYEGVLYKHSEQFGEVQNLVHIATDVMIRIDQAANRARTMANEARGLAAIFTRLEGTPAYYEVDGASDLAELERTQVYLDVEGTRALAYLHR